MKVKKSKLSVRRGGFTVIVTAAILLTVIFINLAVGAIPAAYTKFSETSLYDVSETSKKYLSELNDEIVFYTVVTHGSEDKMLEEYLEKYSEYSSKITLKNIDPAVYPNFLEAYTEETVDAALPTVIVENKSKQLSRVIYYNDIFYDSYGFSYEEFSYYYRYYGSYFTSYFESAFSIENKLTSALDYVTTGISHTIYSTTGHGEAQIDSIVSSLIRDENFNLENLPLKTVAEIPADASAVIVYAPSNDLEPSEIEILEKYINRGGKVIALTTSKNGVLSNFDRFTEEYGLSRDGDKIICEGDADHRGQSATGILYSYLFPIITENRYSSKISNGTLIMHDTTPILLSEEAKDGVTLSSLITSSDKGYLKPSNAETYEKSDGDPEGSYNLAAQAEITNGENTGHLILFGSADIINGNTVQYYSNISYFMAILTELCEKPSSVTIGSQSLQIQPLTVSESASDIWALIIVAIVPASVLIYGICIWRRRTLR